MACGRICSSSIKESVGKSLADHHFKDGSQLEERVDAHRPDLRPEVMFM